LFVYPDPERTDGHRSIQTTLLFLLSSTTSRRQQQRPRRRPQFDQIQNPPVLTAVLDSLPVARRGCSVLNSIPHSCPVLLTRRRSRSIRFLLCCSGKQPPYLCLQLACFLNAKSPISIKRMEYGWMDGLLCCVASTL